MIGSMGADVNPELGIYLFPYTGVGYGETSGMRPRDILAANFRKLMEASPSLSTFPAITKAGGGANGTLDRIRRRESGASVDTMGELAAVFGLQAWQMLVPSLEARTGPDGKAVVQGLPDWPFPLVAKERYEVLSDTQKGYVQARILQAIEECEEAPAQDGQRVLSDARGVLNSTVQQKTKRKA